MMRAFFVGLVVVALCATTIVWLVGSTNPFTPAGYVGYLTKGAIFDKAQFKDLQTGPVSPGREWLVYVQNVSIAPFTFPEPFDQSQSVLAKDNLKIQFAAHIIWKVRPERVKDFVEQYAREQNPNESIEEAGYKHFLKEPFRMYVRDKIQTYNGLDIKDNISGIGESIFARMAALTKDTPFEVIATVVGNIQYPDEVTNSVSNKLAATQELERQHTYIEIEKQKAQQRLVNADGIAGAMQKIQKQLTSEYLQYEAIEAQKAMVNSPNHTTVYIPVGPMGVPLTGTFNTATGK